MLVRYTALCAVASGLCAASSFSVNQTSVTFPPSGSDVMSYRVTFYLPGTVCIQALLHSGNHGDFGGFNSTGILTVAAAPLVGAPPTVSQSGDVFTITYAHSRDTVTVTRLAGSQTKFSVNGKAKDIQLSYDAGRQKIAQSIAGMTNEKYFGLGMSGGSTSQHPKNVWNLADAESPTQVDSSEESKAPFFISSSMYGLFNNAWNSGNYSFTSVGPRISLDGSQYSESLEMFVFDATSPAGLVDKYTYLTGRPFLIPVYGLQLGGSDCFHNARHNWHSSSSLAILEKYEDLDIPYGWYQYDDGYGCGISDNGHATANGDEPPFELSVVKALGDAYVKLGAKPGIWASKRAGLGDFEKFISEGNMSVVKTDVAWLGAGYKYAFDNIQMIANTMESAADIRRFIWTICGWAGTSKNAVMWSGDHYGGGKYAKAQIPWYTQAALTGMATVSGDLDGIFAGSQATAVRDLQMKTFMPVLMTMSGWGLEEKEVFAFNGAITGIMRAYLQLKSQMTPYQYTLSYEATQTGLGITRPMMAEFPEDPITWETNDYTLGQFMSGPAFLVVPDPLGTLHIPKLYLPGKNFMWYDFNTNFWRPQENQMGPAIPAWGTGIPAGKTLENLQVPLNTQAVFVKEGSVIPMWWRPLRHVKDVNRETMPLLVSIWAAPASVAQILSGDFNLYEDDGVTQAYRRGESTMTKISWMRSQKHVLTVTMERTSDSPVTPPFRGAPATRDVILQFPVIKNVLNITANGQLVRELGSLNSLNYYPSGWILRSGMYTQIGLHVKLNAIKCDEKLTVTINFNATQD